MGVMVPVWPPEDLQNGSSIVTTPATIESGINGLANNESSGERSIHEEGTAVEHFQQQLPTPPNNSNLNVQINNGEDTKDSVSSEAAGSESSTQVLRVRARVHDVERLDRVVIDEAHMLVTTNDFRESFLKLDWFTTVGTQCVFLTATLPNWMDVELRQLAFLHNVTLVRANVASAEY